MSVGTSLFVYLLYETIYLDNYVQALQGYDMYWSWYEIYADNYWYNKWLWEDRYYQNHLKYKRTRVENNTAWYKYWNARYTMIRIMFLIRAYYLDAVNRARMADEIKFKYERNPFYEQGFIMCEIVERYRRMVEAWQHIAERAGLYLPECIKDVEFNQKYWMEIWHLVNMMHEIPKKYTFLDEYEQVGKFRTAKPTVDPDIIRKKIAEIERRLRLKRLENKARIKHARALQKWMQETKGGTLDHYLERTTTRASTRWWWPQEYGWEIDYYW